MWLLAGAGMGLLMSLFFYQSTYLGTEYWRVINATIPFCLWAIWRRHENCSEAANYIASVLKHGLETSPLHTISSYRSGSSQSATQLPSFATGVPCWWYCFSFGAELLSFPWPCLGPTSISCNVLLALHYGEVLKSGYGRKVDNPWLFLLTTLSAWRWY